MSKQYRDSCGRFVTPKIIRTTGYQYAKYALEEAEVMIKSLKNIGYEMKGIEQRILTDGFYFQMAFVPR